jgi:DNA-directed RNA polymerase I, II, and III subunit RPABC2
MDNDDIGIPGGMDDEEFDELDEVGDELEEQEAEDSFQTPALRRLYGNHPECLPDYVESVMMKVPIGAAPPRTITSQEAAETVLQAGDAAAPSAAELDANHTTYPFLTKYEATRIIGFRSNQLSNGAQPFVTVPDHVTDVREIARLELAAKRLPFIVKRPLPDGTYEYWRLQDLAQI